MKRNFFLFLLLFLFTLTASVAEMSHDVNLEKTLYRVKTFAIDITKAQIKGDCKRASNSSGERTPMILRTLLFEN